MTNATKVPLPQNAKSNPDHKDSRSQLDKQRRRLAFALIAVLLLVFAGTGTFFYIKTFILPHKHLVVRVNDVRYTLGDMLVLVRVKQKQVESRGQVFDLTTAMFQTLQDLVQNEIIKQRAPEFGLSVSEEEIDEFIRMSHSDRTGETTGDVAAQFEREFQERYRAYLNEIQISESEHRELTGQQILRAKMKSFLAKGVPTVTEQVHLHRIVITTQDESDIMNIKFKDAVSRATTTEELQEAYELIAREFSRDKLGLAQNGGDLGWVPRGVLLEQEYAFFDLPIGELSRPTTLAESPDVLVYFMVSERDDAHKLDPEARRALADKVLDDWLNEERQSSDVYSRFDSHIYEWMVNELGLTTIEQPTSDSGTDVPGLDSIIVK